MLSYDRHTMTFIGYTMSGQFTVQTIGTLEERRKRKHTRLSLSLSLPLSLSLISPSTYLGGYYSGLVRQIREYLLQDNAGQIVPGRAVVLLRHFCHTIRRLIGRTAVRRIQRRQLPLALS